MKLTVVICTHNRSNLLMLTIASLNEATLPTDCSIDLLVVANSCNDDTLAQLKNYSSSLHYLPLTIIEEPRTGKSYALNRAIDIVKSDFVCFVDDDHRIDINYFNAITNSIQQNREASILCGRIIPDWTGLEPSWIHDEGKYKIYPLPIPHFELGSNSIEVSRDTKLPGGGNLIAKSAIFKKIGDFSTTLGPKGRSLAGSEDSEFILRALDACLKIQYIPNIIQYHYVDLDRLKLPYLILKSFQRTRSLILAKKPARSSIPLYMWRKLFNYTLAMLFAFNTSKIRFYLMRLASTAGEMIGLIENRRP